MGELQTEFLRQTIANLQNLQQNDFGEASLTEDFLWCLFRQLHTIKGTSNTFNLTDIARLAHQTEDLLQAIQKREIDQSAETNRVIKSSLEHLLEIANNYLGEIEILFPVELSGQINSLIPNSKVEYQKDFLKGLIPTQFLSQLSEPERITLNTAVQNGRAFYLLEVFFDLATFYEDFKIFKQILSEVGEVIAVAPLESTKPAKEIAFQVFYTTNSTKTEIEKLIDNFKHKVVFEYLQPNQNNYDNLAGTIGNLIAKGKTNARVLNKDIVFESSLELLEISHKNLVLLNEIISHLLHNAIDHGIESVEERAKLGKNPTGKIELKVSQIKEKICLQISDDGRGLDVDKISARAKEQRLISTEQVLDDKKILELIFSKGLSTKDSVSEISGRGVGLDAVKDLVEKSGGKIEMKTVSGQGLTFTIYLLQN